ncbi:hypothetical protein MTR67_039333 [Solanum verrucosum]|uniref:Uncharacterized protein n=1 Tax=Solanum verrucosum TaxID=315347 RepID=A0AAF0ZQA7_SOLVR|nr:hypothetical protein MTR67_039333 [Solanum verrucosum]
MGSICMFSPIIKAFNMSLVKRT